MAGNTLKERIQLDILVNGDNAQKEYHDLIQEQRKLKDSLQQQEAELRKVEKAKEAVNDKMKKLEENGKKESAQYKKLSADLVDYGSKVTETKQKIKDTNTILEVNERRIVSLRQQIGLTKMTTSQLASEQKLLQQVLKNTIPGTAEWKKYKAELKAVEAQMGKLAGKSEVMKVQLSGFVNKFNKFFGFFVGLVAMLTGISMKFRQLAQEVAKMDDVYSDVIKTTGMTHQEVKELNEAFKKMDTRTAREELNKFAVEAGKLGIEGKENILQFVAAADKIKMIVGQDLGDDAVKTIAKMVNILSGSTKQLQGLDLEKQMLSVGSAILKVGQSSTASEPYLVQFSGRLAGVAAQANISMGSILGFASSLDQDMQKVEMSATAMQKFIMKLFQDPAMFAKMAGMEVKKFTDLLQNDANAAIIAVLEALNQKGGFQQLVPIFKDMGLDGARAVGVLSAMSKNIEQVKTAQDIANKALADGNLIVDVYNQKNNNLQAQLEKRKKAFKEAALELGERLNPALLKSTKIMTYIIKVAPAVLDFFAEYGAAIVKLVTIIALYNIANALTIKYKQFLGGLRLKEAIQMRVELAQLNANTFATHAYALVTNLLTGNIKGATKALKGMWTTMKANPIGLILAAGTALYFLLDKLKKNMDATKNSMKQYSVSLTEISEKTKELSDNIIEEKNKFNFLISSITDANTSTDRRTELIKKLKSEYPQFLKYIDAEKISNNALLAIQKEVNAQYSERLRIAALMAKAKAHEDVIIRAHTRIIETDEEIDKIAGQGGNLDDKKHRDAKIEKLEKERSRLQQLIKTNEQEYNKYATQAANITKKLDNALTPEGIEKQIENYENAWKISQNRLTKARENENTKEIDFYKNQSEELKNHIAGLQEQLESAKLLAPTLTIIEDDEEIKPDYTPPGGDPAKSDPGKEKLKSIEAQLQEEINALKQYRNEGVITEKEYNEIVNTLTLDSIKRKMEIKELEKEELTKINQQRLDLEYKMQKDCDKELLTEMQERRDERLRVLDNTKNEELEKLQETVTTQKAYAILSKEVEAKYAHERLQVLKEYGYEVEDAEFAIGEIQLEAIKENGEAIIAAEAEILKRRAIAQKEFDRLFKPKGFKERKAAEIELVNQILPDKKGEDGEIIANEIKQKALADIEKRYNDERYRARQQAGIASLYEQFVQEKTIFEEMRADELITENEYQQALLELRINYVQKYVDFYAQSIGGLVDALKDGETARLDDSQRKERKTAEDSWDAKIKAAKKGSKRQKKLEEEKAAALEELDKKQAKEKAELNKKYADFQFATQLAQLIASTAVAVMQAFSQLGPIGGAIAGALISATATVQAINLNKERQRIKSMPTEFYTGGYTGGKNKYKPAGTVHEDEFVANQDAVHNPTVRPVLDIIDYAQRNGMIKQIDLSGILKAQSVSSRGYERGGYTSARNIAAQPVRENPRVIPSQDTATAAAITHLYTVIGELKDSIDNGISATVIANDDYIRTHRRANKNWETKRKQLNP